MEIQVAGSIFWGDGEFEYYLVDPHPVMGSREDWMTDQDEIFKVCQENGRVFEIIVSRPFLISRLNMGKRIEIIADETYAFDEEDEETEKINKLFSITNISP